MRALLFALMGSGKSYIETPLVSPDTLDMVRAAELLGARIDRGDRWIVQGVGGHPKVPDQVIDAGNSGQILRFIGAIAALSSGWTVLTGDASIRARRSAAPLLDGIRQLGGVARSTRGSGFAPFVVGGPLSSGRIVIDGQDSQPVSALLMAAAFLDGETEIATYGEGEPAWVDLTLSWLLSLGIEAERTAPGIYRVVGPASYEGIWVKIPGDASSAAFPMAAALITGGEVDLEGLVPGDHQGDACALGAMEEREVDLANCIDALPILAVVGCYTKGETRLRNGAMARQKESDRIASIAAQLRLMGADLEELDDGLIVRESALQGADLSACGDHRIAMALIVAALGAKGASRITGIEWIEKSFPHFIEEMKGLGAIIE